MKRFIIGAVLAAAFGGNVAIGDTSAVRKDGTIRIMLLGDSITHGSHSSTGNGYRAPLWNALTNLGYRVDFVGTQTDSYGRFDPTLGDPDHEGISGITIAGTLRRIDGVFDKCGEVDCVLMLLGTNESLLGERVFRNEATNSLVRLLDRIHARSPSAEVVVATLMPRWTEPKVGNVSANWKYTAITNVFNPAVPGIVAGQCAKGQHAHMLDMHAAIGFDQLDDEVHPNDSGYASMAKFWLGAVTNIFPRPSLNVSDDLPTSVVMWVCPDEPFAAGIGKPRYYRKSFETKEGLVKATARWWVDDTGSVFVDGKKLSYSAMMVDKVADLTTLLKKPGSHVMAIEGTNLAAAGGVCVSIDLEYADGRHDSVYTDGSWKCATERGALGITRPTNWTSINFDDSGWAAVKVYGDLFTAPWTSVADMTQMELYGERRRRAEVEAAREARVEKALAAMERETKPVCKVVYENGKSYFDIGGKRFETTYYNCNENWNGGNRGLRRQVAAFRDAGMHVYGLGVLTPNVWRADGTIDYAAAERKMRDVLSIDPEARFQFCITTSFPPKWWMDAHPDELVAYANAEVNPTEWDHIKNCRAPSFASKVWRRDMCDYITRLVKYLESTPYAKRIFAYRPDFGVYHEWHYYGMAECMPDVGKAMAAAFGKPIPSKEERLRTSAGVMRDPVKDRAALDFVCCMAEQVRDCLLEFDSAIKKACDGRALVGNYYGYFFGMPFRAEGWHIETDTVLDSPYVDFLCSPYDYAKPSRGAGNLQYARCLLEGCRRRGKLAVLEADTRTTLHKAVGDNLHAKTRPDDIALLARDFAGTLCWGCGFWYYDFGYGWYDAPEFTELFKKIYPIRREIKDCRSVAEVLVVGDFESVLYTNADSPMFCHERTSGLVYQLGHAGVPFDSASVADVASGKLKDYKLYIFCNLHHKTPEKERIVKNLRAKGKTVLLPENPLSTAELRTLFAKEGIHVWNDDADSAIYASASCVALHCATGGEKTIRLPRRAKVTMLYPERREVSADTDRIVFTPQVDGMSTTIFRYQ